MADWEPTSDWERDVATMSRKLGRLGCREIKFGFVRDGVPVDQAEWFAHCQVQVGRAHRTVGAERRRHPRDAIEALLAKVRALRDGKDPDAIDPDPPVEHRR